MIFRSVWGSAAIFLTLLHNTSFLRTCSAASDPVVLWKFDEGRGKEASSRFKSVRGTLKGAPRWVEGVEDTALYLNGVDQYLTAAANILDNATAATLMAWIKLESYAPSGQTPIMVDRTPNAWDFQFVVLPDDFIPPHKLMFSLADHAGKIFSVVSDLDIPLNIWTHVAGVYDGKTVRVFIDGKQDGPVVPFSDPLASGSDDFRVGADVFGSDRFHGAIDEVAIYEHALSLEEIRHVFESGRSKAKQGTLVLLARGPDGRPLPQPGGIFVIDMQLAPVAVLENRDGTIIVSGLPRKPIMFDVYLEVPAFGNLRFTAANDDCGYLPEGQILDILYEVARHRCSVIKHVMEEMEAKGVSMPTQIQNRFFFANTLVREASQFTDGSREKTMLSLLSLKYSGPVGEEVVLERGRQQLVQEKGIANKLVSTFALYGAREGRAWQEAMAPLFDTGVQYWHWAINMPEDDQFQWSVADFSQDTTVSWLVQNGKSVRGHALVVFTPLPWWYVAKYPYHPYPKSFDDAKRVVLAFTRSLVHRYPQVEYWVIANEANNSWGNLGFLEPGQMIEIIGVVSEEVRRINPTCRRGIHVIPWVEDAAHCLNKKPRIVSPYTFLEMINNQAVEYEYIGLQLYFNGRDLLEIDQLLETYRNLGKPIHICEMQTSSNSIPDKGNNSFPDGLHPAQKLYQWHRPWDEDLQADWLEGMFIVCLGKDYVDEWNWWDIADYEDHYYPWGGLMTADYSAKAGYIRLKQLIARWKPR